MAVNSVAICARAFFMSPERKVRSRSQQALAMQLAGPQIQQSAPQNMKSRAASSEPETSCSRPS